MPKPKQNRGFDSDGITYKSLLQFVKDASSALEAQAADTKQDIEYTTRLHKGPQAIIDTYIAASQEAVKSYENAAYYFTMIAEYLENDYKPSKGLKFDTKILGL